MMEKQRILDELWPREAVLWEGKPSCCRLLHWSDILLIPFSFLWCGFAIVWELLVLSSQESLPFFAKLWGIPFICIGLYLVGGRFIHMWYVRRHTWYVLTTARILVFCGGRTIALPYQGISFLEKHIDRHGRGIIYFEKHDWYQLIWRPFFPVKPIAFEDVNQADKAYEIIQERINAFQGIRL